MQVKVINRSKHSLPEYETSGSSGMDVRADIKNPITLKPLERKLFKTGLFVEVPLGYEMQVRPRSGLAFKKGITVLNSPGTIDSDYRGEIGVLLVNLSTEEFVVEDGERIAQLVLASNQQTQWKEVLQLDESNRGQGGFGSTGTK